VRGGAEGREVTEVPTWKIDIPDEHVAWLKSVLPEVAETNLNSDQIALFEQLAKALRDGREISLTKLEWTILVDEAVQSWAASTEPRTTERMRNAGRFGSALDRMLSRPATGERAIEPAVDKPRVKQMAMF
jgi:hypothetical protein